MGSEENKKGFTLIELLIVLALSTVAITAGFLFVQGFKSSRDLEFDLAEAASAVKSTQKKSVTQENGKRWSIRFSATTTGPDKYEVYSGANYSSSSVDQLYTFRRGSSLSEPSGNRSKDLQFKPVTGKIDRKKIITLKHSGVNNFVGDIIVNKRGLVTKRLESDIIGYWHFNKGTGTSTIDATGNGNEGVFNGDPSWASVNGCKVGQCLDFDGSGDYISVQHSGGFFSDMNKISISFWAKWDSFNSWSRIIDFGSSGGSNGAVLVANESGGNDFIFEIRDSSGSSLGKCEVVDGIKKDEWIYWVAVWTEGEQKVYKDGTLVKTCNFAGSWSSISEPNKWFGKSNWSGDDFYNGKIDEMRIYNKALSSSTIKEIYNTTK